MIFPVLFSFPLSVSAEVDLGLLMDYQIQSDEYNESVPQGYFMLKGSVSNTTTGKKVENAMIANEDESIKVFTDSSGTFKVLFPNHINTVYCYKEGLTEVIMSYDFKNRHLIEVSFLVRDPEEIIIVTKPVIYLYNSPKEVNISLKARGDLSFTYPEINNEWIVCSNMETDGVTDLTTGLTYPYLFWEGENDLLNFNISNGELEGYLIKTDTCISFLEGVLNQFGFNWKEKADFISFWGPQFVQKEYALVQFLVDEAYDGQIAGIEVNPSPDSQKRVYILLNLLDDSVLPFEVRAPKIEKFDRNGYTLIEWGGSLLNKPYLL